MNPLRSASFVKTKVAYHIIRLSMLQHLSHRSMLVVNNSVFSRSLLYFSLFLFCLPAFIFLPLAIPCRFQFLTTTPNNVIIISVAMLNKFVTI